MEAFRCHRDGDGERALTPAPAPPTPPPYSEKLGPASRGQRQQPGVPLGTEESSPKESCFLWPQEQNGGSLTSQKNSDNCFTPAKHYRKKCSQILITEIKYTIKNMKRDSGTCETIAKDLILRSINSLKERRKSI